MSDPERAKRTVFLLLFLLLAGPRAGSSSEASFEIIKSSAPTVRVGKRAEVSLSVLPRAGHRLLGSGPVLVRVHGDNVVPARPLLRREDAVDPRAEAPRFELSFTPVQPGAERLFAECTFWLCREARCRPVTTTVDWTFEIAP
jgi:hypothetical protein